MKLTVSEKKEPSLAFGGQAVIEGVMIRSKKHKVICVRQPDGKILTEVEEIRSVSERYEVLKLPVLRGIAALFETMYLGIKGLYFSADAALEEEEEELDPKVLLLALVLGVALAIFLFSILPFFLTTLLNLRGVLFNVVEAAVRLSILLLYLASMALVGDLKRVFQYHGAEHAAINAYEAGVELSVLNAKKFSRFHPRCGTSFLLIVTLISILLFSIMPDVGFFTRLAYRILLIPLISGISYEVLKLSDRYKESRVMKALVAPGLGLQFLTTRKPNEQMIEVAIEAIKQVHRLAETSQ